MNKQQLCVVQAELMKLTPHRWDKGLTIMMKLQLCDHLDAYVSTNLISYIWGHPSKVGIWLHLGPGVSSHFCIWNSIGFEIHLDFWDTVFCMPQHFLIYFTVDFQLVVLEGQFTSAPPLTNGLSNHVSFLYWSPRMGRWLIGANKYDTIYVLAPLKLYAAICAPSTLFCCPSKKYFSCEGTLFVCSQPSETFH